MTYLTRTYTHTYNVHWCNYISANDMHCMGLKKKQVDDWVENNNRQSRATQRYIQDVTITKWHIRVTSKKRNLWMCSVLESSMRQLTLTVSILCPSVLSHSSHYPHNFSVIIKPRKIDCQKVHRILFCTWSLCCQNQLMRIAVSSDQNVGKSTDKK